MIKNKLFLQQKDHRYFLIPLSVTKLVNSYFNKEISEKTRGTVHFKKAVEFGNQFHKIAQKIIELKRINKFQQERFLYELQHQNYDYDLFKVVLVFIDWMKDEILFPENIVAEKQICGKIKTNLEPEVVIAGTFDALDFKNMVLYEWKTTSGTIDLPAWKLQTRIYNHILGNKIKKVVIYNPKINFYEEFTPKPLNPRELFVLLDHGIYLIERDDK